MAGFSADALPSGDYNIQTLTGHSIFMNKIKQVTETIIAQGMLPLYYHADETVSLEILQTLYDAGIQAVEYTNRGNAALSNFSKMIERRDAEMPGLLLGVGTIKNIRDAENYLRAGADFLVSPGMNEKVAVHCLANDIFYAPGCMSPTEIMAAENVGIQFIKIFPADLHGPQFLASIRAVFPNLKFMPTGGVDATKENIEAWFKAGVSAVGMGSKLISNQRMTDKDYATIAAETRKVIGIIQEVKKSLAKN